MRRGAFVLLLGLVYGMNGQAQNYNAVKGSPFAGSLGVFDNPASILNTPYPWDITIFSLQVQNSTNAGVFHPLSYLSHKDTLAFDSKQGYFRRFAAFNYNVHLLNVRLALSRKAAIAFGANLRGYGAAHTGPANYNDTLQNMNQFFSINEGSAYNANMVSSSWLELFFTYSRTILDNDVGRLNGGITLKAMRGISGAYAQVSGSPVSRSQTLQENIYSLNAASARYAYSANYDLWQSSQSTTKNLTDFLGHTQGGAAVDLGVEWLVKSQAVTNYADMDRYYHEYEWKIGISLLDLGANRYQYGSQSRAISSPKTNVTDLELNNKINGVNSLAGFNDSISTLVNNMSPLAGMFTIWNPARLAIDVDRPLQDQFAVNAGLTLNLGGSAAGKRFFVKDMNLLTITPRWETRTLGAYLPMLVTTEGKFWVGGAFKAGPVLLGFHNWANLFSKSKIQNGGFYLALTIRPGSGFFTKENKKYTCPAN